MLLYISSISGSSNSHNDNFEWLFHDRIPCILLSVVRIHRVPLNFTWVT